MVELVQDYMEVEANQNCRGVSRLIEFLRVSLNLQVKLSFLNVTILLLDCCGTYGPELNSLSFIVCLFTFFSSCVTIFKFVNTLCFCTSIRTRNTVMQLQLVTCDQSIITMA